MQMCEDCGKKPANVHLTQIAPDGAAVTHLCEECAKAKGISITVDGALAQQEPAAEEPLDEGRTCSRCGTTEKDMREKGRIGCRECYSVFADHIDGLLTQMHGTSVHRGKRYSRIGTVRGTAADVERLRGELDRAIKNEDFEEAARLRDTINSLSPLEG